MRFNNLNGVRAIASMGILMMHYFANLDIKPEMGILTQRIIPWFTNFVFLFFVVSAFGMCCGYYEKVKNGAMSPLLFYKKRYLRILPFYALLCCIDLIMNFNAETAMQVFVNLTFTNGLLMNPDRISVIGVGWFLGVVFLFYMVFPFFVFMIHSKRSAWVSMLITTVLCAMGLVYFFAPDFIPDIEMINHRQHIFCSAVFFVLGGLLYLYSKSIYNIMQHYGHFLAPCGLVAFLAYLCFFTSSNLLLQWFGYLVASALIMLCVIAPDSKIMTNKIMDLFGKYSFEIYLCHMVMFRGLEKVHLTTVVSNANLNYFIVVAVGLMCSILFSIGFHKAYDNINQFISGRTSSGSSGIC
ncbi:MAG: acyltransferase [Paramuribaculum sp.]|nr:acyltransferase [Paramuribaculum sp.]